MNKRAELRRRLRFWWRYLRGNTPWDTGITPPEIVALADTLSPGRALDLGCGTGTNVIYLAQRNWNAVGVDFAASAVAQARRKARRAGVTDRASFYAADATRLEFLQPPFDLIVDIGCLHGIPADRQAAYAEGVRRLAAPEAHFALYAHCPRLMRGEPIGLTPDQVRALFGAFWRIERVETGQDSGTQHGSAWYWLRRAQP